MPLTEGLRSVKPVGLLEPDFAEPYQTWKANPTPEANATILKTLDPVIQGAIRTHVGEPNPLLVSRARRMTLGGLRTYDPARGRLQTHLYNQLLGLKRVASQQSQVLRVPQRVAMDRYQLEKLEHELQDELGREPTDLELADRSGFSVRRLARIRSYRPAVAEGTLEAVNEGQIYGSTHPIVQRQQLWQEIIYSELDPYHQKVMELTLGLHGRRPLANSAIARKLGKSPGAISQAKLRIQQLLDQQDELEHVL